MKVHRTIRYRLHPRTQAKHDKLFGLAGACRYVWNHFVGKLRQDYIFYGSCNPYCRYKGSNNDGLAGLNKLFTIFRNSDRRAGKLWLQQYSMGIVRGVLPGIERAYKRFYKGGGGLPRFKKAFVDEPSILLPTSTFKLQGGWLYIQKLGQVKVTGNNPYKGCKALNGTIKREAGEWYAYIVFAVEQDEAAVAHEIKAVGIDRNVGQVATSERTIYRMRNLERLEARRRRYQKMMSRRDKGCRKTKRKPSRRYLRARELHQKTHERIVHARTNWCHQVSRELADRFDVAYMEDLNIKGMTASAKGTAENPGKHVKQKSGLNKGILRTGWYRFEQCLGYKTSVVKVPAAYTSQTCSVCGFVDKENRKPQSEFECRECGHRDNADVNAALNILASGNGAAGRGAGDIGRALKRQIDGEVVVNFSI